MSESFKGSRAFLMIPPGISRDKDLLKRPKSIILMGEIISMLNVTGSFYMSNSTIAKLLDCTTQAVNNYLSLLESKGLIKRKKIFDPDHPKRIIGRQIYAGDDLVKLSLLGWSTGVGKGSQRQFSRVVNASLHKENNIKEQNNRSSNISSSIPPKNDKPADPFKITIHSKEEEEEFINSLMGYFYESALISSFPPNQEKQIKKELRAMKPEDARELMDQVVQSVKKKTVGDPAAYLITSLRNAGD